MPIHVKKTVAAISPLKSPVNENNNILINKRPKRICRLPSKFDDHSISPSKYIPLQPINASTPLANKAKKVNKKAVPKKVIAKDDVSSAKVSNEKQKTLKDFFNNSIKTSNNNMKGKKQKPQITSKKSPTKLRQSGRKITEKNFSFKILEDNKKSCKRDSSKLDVYEFTYDPDEEPPPAKKRRKKTATKKPAKPKTVKVKSNYDKNLAKALATLKNAVSPKPFNMHEPNKTNVNSNQTKTTSSKTLTKQNTNKDVTEIYEKNYNSVRVEDIAIDMQADDISIDYSPVNSPNNTPQQNDHPKPENRGNDPLNLQDDLSFFDEPPAASSSMNVSTRHPLASPWRVEFGNLPIKWHANTYVKPNMTPAVESSFINISDSKKKHVYTNMLTEANDSLPDVENTPNLKQTSIMSFIREVIDKNESRKSKSKSTPVKANSLFEDISNTSIVVSTKNKETTKMDPKLITPEKHSLESTGSSNILKEVENITDQENVLENSTPKAKNKKKDNNITYFGFDSEDQENISPKNKNKARSLRSRTRGILQELNVQNGPMRAVLPVSKSKPNQSVVNKLLDGMKSATEPPVFPEVVECNRAVAKVTEPSLPENDENDSESVHLFEDIELIHHHKPSRKSYSKPKKVIFNTSHTRDGNSSSPGDDVDRVSEDDLEDLSFKLPSEKPKKTMKKKKNKPKLSKKEEKEVEVWAARFNSMCEDINDFDLLVE